MSWRRTLGVGLAMIYFDSSFAVAFTGLIVYILLSAIIKVAASDVMLKTGKRILKK